MSVVDLVKEMVQRFGFNRMEETRLIHYLKKHREVVLTEVAEKVRYADLESEIAMTGYEATDPVDCLKAQAHAFIIGLREE